MATAPHGPGGPAPEPLGPTPTPTTPAMPPARARVAAQLDGRPHPVTLADLVEALGGHPNATRAHLEHLVAAGHVQTTPLPRTGPGRPALGYTLTNAGRNALAGDPAITAYAELVSAMARQLARMPDATGMARAIGRDWAAARVAKPSRRALLALLSDLGFTPEVSGAVIRLRTCPILSAATEHPEIVCAIHAGLAAGAVDRNGVRLLPFAEPGSCRLEIG